MPDRGAPSTKSGRGCPALSYPLRLSATAVDGGMRTGQIRYAVTSKKASALGTAPPPPQMMDTFPALSPVPNATVAAFEMAKQPAPALMFAVFARRSCSAYAASLLDRKETTR